MTGSVEDFYAAMAREEAHFKNLYQAAVKEGKKLKFVARNPPSASRQSSSHAGLANTRKWRIDVSERV